MPLFVADKLLLQQQHVSPSQPQQIFCRWPERGKTFSHTKRKIFIWETKHFLLCRKEEQILFSLTLQFFFHFFPWLSVATAGRSTDRSEYATTLFHCVEFRFNILCAVELIESILTIFFFVTVFLVDIYFCDTGFFKYDFFHFFLFLFALFSLLL